MIRKSTDEDLVRVLRWSKSDQDGGQVSFFCSSHVMVHAHFVGSLYVILEGDDPVGVLATGETAPEILVVRASKRGMGYGKQLARFMFDYWHVQRDQIWIHFEPKTAMSFWLHMGCAVDPRDAARVYHERDSIEVALPDTTVEVDLTVFSGDDTYVVRPGAARIGDRIHLDRQVRFVGDVLLEIKIEGNVLYKGPCRDEPDIGLHLDPSGFGVYLDTIENAYADEDIFEDSDSN
jgi:hypothetical protein